MWSGSSCAKLFRVSVFIAARLFEGSTPRQ
jgi:hypothetical protein